MEERRFRASTVAGLAVLLVGLTALVATVGDGANAVEMLQVLQSTKVTDSDSTTAADSDAVSVKSALSTADTVALGGSSKSMRSQLRSLKKTYGAEQSLVGKINVKVDKAELAQKKTLLVAKSMMNKGMQDELLAKMNVDKASKMRAEAQKLRNDSEAARRKFVAQEHPVLLAQRLAQHDHKKYRSDEMSVAKEVALLSEHPSSKKLRTKVDNLVKHSKQAKERMAEDGMLLKKLEKKTADAQLGGAKGYSGLKRKSVKIAKSAESIAQDAVSLAKKGHSEKVKARAQIKIVEQALKQPDKEHATSEADEKKAVQTHKVIGQIQNKIEQDEAATAAAAEAKHKKKEAAIGSSYSRERKRLMEEVDGKSVVSKKEATHHESDEQKQLKAARSSYDELEQLEEKKEKARLRREQHREDKGKANTHVKPVHKTKNSAAEEKASQLKDAEKRAHILSERQSTFLSGLFSTKSPWDTKKTI
eukprot:CAMPEP_0179434512 /NCGR_PEP_ID=MMETSP0799-20121207/18817_1 /TAXON_ID=46947 /ORGANISM="Geminigera cryophila, Strain CCMP2564" /LENGTH=475 /DNA_ID=CAMNT_0021213347 /DNA_START=100 /DNA_END=1527 /DNA_ORIENTATION=-